MTRRGHLISLEGIDGSGKSTHLALLADALRERGIDVETTREPGGTALGERLREIVLHAGVHPSPAAEALLFAAARAQLVHEVIRPALSAGRWVICDRFVDSSLAYQGVARGIGLDEVWQANQLAVGDCLPSCAIVFDIDPAVAHARTDGDDRIEAQGDGFQRAVAEGYHVLARRFPERVVLVDAAGDVDQVHARVMAVVEPLL